MPIYSCETCNFSSKFKGDFTRHLKSKKHQVLSQSKLKVTPSKPKVSPSKPKVSPKYLENDGNTELCCENCGATFRHKQSLSRHKSYTCPKIVHRDMNEIVEQLNKKNNYEQEQQKIENNRLKKDIKKKEKAIERLSKKLELVQSNVSSYTGNNSNNTANNSNNTANNSYNTTNNTQNLINTQNNIIVNYKDTDMSHLTQSDVERIMNRCKNCIPEFVRQIHCNKTMPQNMNIYIPNIQNKYIMIYEDGEWLMNDRDTVLESLIEDRTCRLEEWIDDNEEICPELKKKFCKYMDYRNSNYESHKSELKHEIQLDLYNLRNKVNKKNRDT